MGEAQDKYEFALAQKKAASAIDLGKLEQTVAEEWVAARIAEYPGKGWMVSNIVTSTPNGITLARSVDVPEGIEKLVLGRPKQRVPLGCGHFGDVMFERVGKDVWMKIYIGGDALFAIDSADVKGFYDQYKPLAEAMRKLLASKDRHDAAKAEKAVAVSSKK